ncbi:MAG: hypothetical protein KJ747_09865, partial [Actinobacteria bacterium]|nr:hypothetical protein [Actinomycetota bacterium]
MVDDLTPQSAAPTGSPLPDPTAKPGFFSTSTGKIVLIVGAVLAFLAVAGVVVVVVMTFFLGNAVNEAITQGLGTTTSQSATGTAPAETAMVPIEPSDIPLSDLFTFRDIFEPLVKPAPEVDASTDASATPEGEAGTLYLLNIVVEDGVSKAVLLYNNTQYSLPQNGVVTGTPWQVLSIGSSSVVMLYGDSQISLSVGQGVVESNPDVSSK